MIEAGFNIESDKFPFCLLCNTGSVLAFCCFKSYHDTSFLNLNINGIEILINSHSFILCSVDSLIRSRTTSTKDLDVRLTSTNKLMSHILAF